MKKTSIKNRKPKRKPGSAARAHSKSIIADLGEFAEALESRVPLESKYTVRRVQFSGLRK